jgi:hypothetical protein
MNKPKLDELPCHLDDCSHPADSPTYGHGGDLWCWPCLTEKLIREGIEARAKVHELRGLHNAANTELRSVQASVLAHGEIIREQGAEVELLRRKLARSRWKASKRKARLLRAEEMSRELGLALVKRTAEEGR